MKRILFVDDEPALLDGLRGRLRSLRDRWDMIFVESGARAIAEMEQGAVDVVVTDMRMPRMDGAELLTIVRDRWPECIRIVLSGFAEDEQSAKLLTVAHQYMSKPCDSQQIENVVGRCLDLHELLSTSELRAVVGGIGNLPALPRTYARLRDIAQSGTGSVREVARVVYEDPAIAAKVLQVVNSSFFRLARRITSIEQAVGYLGFNAIRTLAMAIEVSASWRIRIPVPGMEPESLGERAQRLAAGARALCVDNGTKDDAMLAGLFHNIGHWIFLQEYPEKLRRAVEIARTEGVPLHEAERRIIGASHAAVGAYLLGAWGLPYPVIEAVAFQFDPPRVGEASFSALSALIIASRLSAADDASMLAG